MDDPLQIVPFAADAFTTGFEFTVIVMVVEFVQPLAFVPVTVYVVVTVGVAVTVVPVEELKLDAGVQT